MPKLDLRHLRDDKLAFIEKLLTHPDGTPCKPHPTQADFLRGITRQTTLVAGRQWGKSTAFGWDAVWAAVTHANWQVFIIGPTLDQARIIFNEVADHFRRLPLKALVEGKIIDFPFPRIRLSNGTEIHARGANSPQFLRGKRAHRIYVDETAFIKDAALTDVIEPMMTVTGKDPDAALVTASTPFGHGYFHDVYNLGKDGGDPIYSSYSYTAFDNPFADMAFLERQKARYGEDSLLWRTEYMGEFADADNAVFPWDDIKWAYDSMSGLAYPAQPQEKHRYLQGVDLANQRDWFVSATIDGTEFEYCPTASVLRYQKRGYGFYKSTIRNQHSKYNNARTLVDATTLAESVVEDLDDIGAEGYKFSGSTAKYEVVEELARMLSEHRLGLPYDRTIIDEFRFFEYKVTPSKAVKVEAVKGHDDVVMAYALAAHMAMQPRRLGLFQPVFIAAPRETDAHRDPVAEAFAF